MYASSLREQDARRPGAMTAQAVLATERDPRGRSSRVSVLRSQGALVLRPANPKGPEPLTHRRREVARVMLAAGTAGPIGGDDYALEVRVGAGSTLVLSEVSAMLVLPGPCGGRSRMRITVHVGEDATFVWLPEPIIAAQGCDHEHDVRVQLEPGARLAMREETLLGRYRECPGDFRTTLRVTYAGAPIYHQQLRFGPNADGWRGAAVLGGNAAVGSIIAVDPVWADETPATSAFHSSAILAPLPGPGVAVSAVAPDSLQLRRLLNAGLDELGPPWSTRIVPDRVEHLDDEITEIDCTDAG
ncbi:urease accessory protein UreD [Pistricoccus aurantiacus]|uniref:urease accessory protein UreD n=1 Tax=Pistricoccus aurantiacus TaxID=1883414 RepID=UPI0036412498